MKKAIAIILLIAAVFSLAACGSSGGKGKNSAAGKYEGVHCKLVGSEEWEDEEFSLELKKDGTGTSTRDGSSYKMTWKLDGEDFTMQETFLGMSIDYTGTLKDGTLDIFNGDPEDIWTYEYVYEKK